MSHAPAGRCSFAGNRSLFAGAGRSTRRTSALILTLALTTGGLWIAPAQAALASSEGAQLAYIDPGAGSFVLQAVVAAFAGVVVAAGAYWSRIKRFLGLGTDGTDSDDETSDPSDDR